MTVHWLYTKGSARRGVGAIAPAHGAGRALPGRAARAVGGPSVRRVQS